MIEKVIEKTISAVKQEIMKCIQDIQQVENRRRMVFQLMVRLGVTT